jgi:FkbM family methyltransferase
MKTILKKIIKDRGVEPYARWLIKRARGIKMPFDLVKDEIYDRQAFEVMGQVLSPKSCCIDIGCHKGQFLTEYMNCAPKGTHFAFEPIPYLYEQLLKNFQSAKIYNYALSDKSGETSFYVLPDKPALSGLNRRETIQQELTREKITVRTERLDDVIPPELKFDYIKIDVEGAEGLVISGALNTIKRNKPYIVIEHGEDSSLLFGISSEDIYEMLVTECGLNISLLADWLSKKPPLTKDEFTSSSGCWYFLAHPASHSGNPG